MLQGGLSSAYRTVVSLRSQGELALMKRLDPAVDHVPAAAPSRDLPLGTYPDASRSGFDRRSELEIRREERCRIGRELHDSTAQLLVALQLRLAFVRQQLGEVECSGLLSDVAGTIDQLHQEIRAVGLNGLDPPLRSGELPTALRAMAGSFGQTSGLHISVDVQGPEIAWPAAAESSLYRIAQEALANVWQHAKATSAAIKLHSLPGFLRLSIEDDGAGIARSQARKNCIGIGLNNIGERARQLGGRLYIRRLRRGTRVTIVVKTQHPRCAALLR